MLSRIENWRDYLSTDIDEREHTLIRRFSSSGRPAGNDPFVATLEAKTGRELARKKPGPKVVDK
jgi:putative transposase